MTRIHLPHFNLGTEPGSYSRGLRRWRGEVPAYSKETAERYISDLEAYTDTQDLPTFWLMKTKPQYPILSEPVSEAIAYVKGELIKVFSETSGIIKLPGDFPNYFKKMVKKNISDKRVDAKIPVKFGRVLAGKIVEWRGEAKISEFILKAEVNDGLDVNKYMDTGTICLSFFEVKNESEKKALKSRLLAKIQEMGISFFDNELFNTITLYSATKENVINISNDDFVEYLDPLLKVNYSISSAQLPTPSRPQIIEVANESLGNICVIDSGVTSKSMENNLRQETLVDTKEDKVENSGHGTLVASIAMFGNSQMGNSAMLKPKANIISYNIWGNESAEINLLDAISTVYNNESKNSRVFNLSVNYPFPPLNNTHALSQQRIAHKLEEFVTQSNIILVNSAGNNYNKRSQGIIKRTPLRAFNLLSVGCPAYAPSILSVGATNSDGTISNYSLINSPFCDKTQLSYSPHFIEEPKIFAFGGNDDLSLPGISCLSKANNVCEDRGTSFASPAVALACQKVIDYYSKNFLKTSESIKAITINSCEKKKFCGRTYFYLQNAEEIGYCSKKLFFNYEGHIKLPIKNDEIKKEIVEFKTSDFYVPKKAKEIEFVLNYAPIYRLKQIDEPFVIPKIIFYGIGNDPRNRRRIYETNLSDAPISLVYGKVEFDANYQGKWHWQLHFEPKNIPKIERKTVLVRFGLSIKVSLADENEETVLEAYKNAAKELGYKEIKDVYDENIIIKAKNSLINFV
jgi:hypothetical protein